MDTGRTCLCLFAVILLTARVAPEARGDQEGPVVRLASALTSLSDSANSEGSSDKGDSVAGAGCACDFQPACARDPLFAVTAEALLLHRSKADARVLIVDQLAGNAPALNVNDLDLGVAAGPRLGVIYQGWSLCDVECSGFRIDGWNSEAHLTGLPLQYAMNNLYGVSFSDLRQVDVSYRSVLSSLEFNLRRQRNEWLTLLAGFRYLELDETFGIHDRFGFGFADESFLTETKNQLYGFQLGADVALWRTGRLRVNALGKAGIYPNGAHEVSSYTYLGTSTAGDRDRLAFAGELGLTAAYQLTPRLALTAGYDLMWISGVALAAEQLDSTYLGIPPQAKVNSAGDVFYHGATVGLEFVY